MRQKFKRAVAIGALASIAGAAIADGSETIFSRALHYTVQIRTAVETPLEGDFKGTLRGAGFLVDTQRGWVLTNAHVVSRSPSRVEVAFQGRPYQDAEKIYVDPHLDLAVVRVALPQGDRREAAPLECDTIPRVGHPVGAFGHPWNMRFTGTRGIVSGTTTRQHVELLQTDAPINQGNSGGPLISLETGRIVGINTAQIRGSQNTNFAVAMIHACRVIELMRAGRDPSPPALPVVYFNDHDDERVLKVARNYGGPGAIGLRPGDIIRGVVGVADPIESETGLYHALRGRLDAFSLRVERGGREVIVHGSARPQSSALDVRGIVAGGVFFAPTPLRDAAEVRVGALMVHHVERGSDGDAKELRRGDFLEAVDGEPVASLEELHDRLGAAGGAVTLTFKRYSGGDRVFTYLERRLRIEGIAWVGPGAVEGRSGFAQGDRSYAVN
ncbi:MAG TPA: trypsin-like peptidase domain-containing protein [Burkholderiales bacterium]|nr:trypsin-like peptidase domain-containing protein [Burkholderiales bacterium]